MTTNASGGAPETVICQFRVKPGSEDAFTDLLRRHWKVLRELELATPKPNQCYVGSERGIEGPLFVEIFEWVDAEASGRAHQHPAVSEVWEAMTPLCEERGGKPAMEFPHFQPLDVG